MPTELSRQWFISGDGIDRHVISADIQRYLGNDATVRPGVGTNENQGVQGFWIKAYRNLTNAMIEDLRADSARWRQEQRQTGTRGSQSPYYKSDVTGIKKPDPFPETYEGSVTYRNSGAGRTPHNRHNTESPSLESPYGVQPPSRMPQDTRMQIDAPVVPPGRSYTQDRTGYAPANQAYADNRPFSNERPGYQMNEPMPSGYNRPPGAQPYQQDPRYAPAYAQGNDNGPSAGFARPPAPFYVPTSASPYDANPAMVTNRPDSAQYGNGYSQPPQGRDLRDARYQQPDYANDSRYAYPSPAVTTVGVNNARDPVTSPQQSNAYGSGPPAQRYDQYGNQRGQYR